MTHRRRLRDLAADERGATAIEYSLIAGCVALVIVTGVQALGGTVKTFYELAAALF